ESRRIYAVLSGFVSVWNVALQGVLLARALQSSLGVAEQVATVVAAYLLADFVNGLVHLYMDRKDDYASPAGPLIANFHLHHQTLRYRDRNLLAVYFIESGSKIWLAGYLALACAATFTWPLP